MRLLARCAVPPVLCEWASRLNGHVSGSQTHPCRLLSGAERPRKRARAPQVVLAWRTLLLSERLCS